MTTPWIEIDFWQKILNQTVHWLITSGPTIIVILCLGFFSFKLSSILLVKFQRSLLTRTKQHKQKNFHEIEKRLQTIIGLVRMVVKVAIWILLFLLILKELGVDIAPMIAGAGILGLAISFGAQSIVKDILAGFSIMVENHIREGDVVLINGTGGLVERINLRTVVLRDLEGTVHIFPNGQINTLSNKTKDWSAALFQIGVAYREDVDRVMSVMKKVGEELRNDQDYADKILEPLEIFGLEKFSESSMVIQARFKTKPIEQWTVSREYNRRLKRAFDAQKIEIPFPQVSLSINPDTNPVKILMQSQPKNSGPSE